MSNPPEAFMIFKEELAKARLEKERLKKEYEQKTSALTKDLANLKEQISAQQDMLKTAWSYAMELESKLKSLEKRVIDDEERNKFGFY